MKNKNFSVIFILVLLVLSSFILLHAQQSPYPYKWATNQILGEQPKTTDHIFGQLYLSKNPTHPQLVNSDLTILNAIIPDFQVNENAGPNGADQDIYAQRYSSDGHVVGPNFRVTNTNKKSDFLPMSSCGIIVFTRPGWTPGQGEQDMIFG